MKNVHLRFSAFVVWAVGSRVWELANSSGCSRLRPFQARGLVGLKPRTCVVSKDALQNHS